MAETIQYSKLVTYVKENIIEDKIPTAIRQQRRELKGGASLATGAAALLGTTLLHYGSVYLKSSADAKASVTVDNKKITNNDRNELIKKNDTFKRGKNEFDFTTWYEKISVDLDTWNTGTSKPLLPQLLWHYQNSDANRQNGNNKDFLEKVMADVEKNKIENKQLTYVRQYADIFSKDLLTAPVYSRLESQITKLDASTNALGIFDDKGIGSVKTKDLSGVVMLLNNILLDASLNSIISYIPVHFDKGSSSLIKQELANADHVEAVKANIVNFLKNKDNLTGSSNALEKWTSFIRKEYNFNMNRNLKKILEKKTIFENIIKSADKSNVTKVEFIALPAVKNIIDSTKETKRSEVPNLIEYYENKSISEYILDRWSLFPDYKGTAEDKITKILESVYEFYCSPKGGIIKNFPESNNWWLLAKAIEEENNKIQAKNPSIEKFTNFFKDYIGDENVINAPSMFSFSRSPTFNVGEATTKIKAIELVYSLGDKYDIANTHGDQNEMYSYNKYICGAIILATILLTAGNVYYNKKDKKKVTKIIGVGLLILTVFCALSWDNICGLYDSVSSYFSNLISDFKPNQGGGAKPGVFDSITGLVTGTKSVKDLVTGLASSAFVTFIKDKIQKYFGINLSPEMITGIIGLVSISTTLFIGVKSFNYFKSYWNSGNESDLKEVNNFLNRVKSGESYSTEAAQYVFNASTGKIDILGLYKDGNIQILISSGPHFGISEIFMNISDEGVITYQADNTNLDSISYIENKPVHTAFVLAYLINDKHFSRLTKKSSSSVGEPEDYKFYFDDNGSLKLTRTQNGVEQEVESVSMVQRKEMSYDATELEEAARIKKLVCKNLFGDEESQYCGKHFTSILGRAGLNMLENLGEAVTTSNILSALNSAEVNIQYEILKNLDWKMKISNGKKTMVSVDEWINRLKSDNKPAIVKSGESYETFFKQQESGSQIKSLLDNMVNRINNNSRLIQEKYQEAVQQSSTISTRRKRLSPEQVAKLKSQTNIENNILNTPFPIPGNPGVLGYSMQSLIGGGENNSYFSDKYKQAFDTMKNSLLGYNQKLSSKTQLEIESKLKSIQKLETELSDLHKKINKYTQILKTEKNARIGRNVSENDIDDLINQYATNSKKQSRYIATITTAFGKIRMLLDKQEMGNSMNQEKVYYSNF